MSKLIIDAAKENIFLMIITSKSIYSIAHKNCKTNYDKLTLLISDFLKKKNLRFDDIETIYINRGPGSFAGVRNSLSIIKAIHMIKKIDFYCYSLNDFKGEVDIKYENIPNLCGKFVIKKNLINPLYLS